MGVQEKEKLLNDFNAAYQENKELIDMVVKKKYLLSGENDYNDLLERFRKGLIEQGAYQDEVDSIISMMSERVFIPAGSILFGYNNKETKVSCSNCYYVPIEEDSIEGIYEMIKRMARIFSYRGGVGVTISTLRPKKVKVNNAAKSSTGAVSFMPEISGTTNTIGQSGRRGAAMIAINDWHPDVLDFIWSKADPERVFGRDQLTGRVPDIEGANISVMLSDKFMEAVESNSDWEFLYPDIEADKEKYNKEWNGDIYEWVDNGGKIVVMGKANARGIFRQIAEAAHKCADPGVLFIDALRREGTGNSDDKLKIRGTNPCQPAFAVVATPNGLKRFGDLQIGDLVWSGKQWTKVVNKVYTGVKPVYRYITPVGTCVSTEDHRVVQNGEKIEVKNAETIDICTVDTANDLDNSTVSLQDVVDGLVMGGGNSDYAKAPTITPTITIDELILASQRTVPERFYIGNKSKVAGFLRGLFSAIGLVDANANKVTLEHPSERMLRQVQEMLSLLGISSYITDGGDTEDEEIKTCTLTIAEDLDRFYQYIGFIQDDKMKKLSSCLGTKEKEKEKDSSRRTSYSIVEKIYLGEHDVWDITVEADEHTYWSGGLLISNCGEQPLPDWGNCLLGAINISAFVNSPWEEDAVFDTTLYTKAVRNAVRALNYFSDYNEDKHPLVQQREMDNYAKRIGLELTALADAGAMLGYVYGSDEFLNFVDKIGKLTAVCAVKESLEIAKDRGSCPALSTSSKREAFIQQPFMRRVIEAMKELEGLDATVKWLDDYTKYGLRNTGFITMGPTGSISIIAGNTSSGVEPLYSIMYTRKTRLSDEPVNIMHMPILEWAVKNNQEATVMLLSKEELLDRFNYVEAMTVNPSVRIKVQSVLQKWVDSSISSTINLSNDVDVETIEDIYIQAWRDGLKGVTIYRDGSKYSNVLTVSGYDNTKNNNKETEPSKAYNETRTIPIGLYEKELMDEEDAKRHRAIWKNNIKVYLNVSIDEEGNPLEIFSNVPYEAGTNGSGEYNHVLYLERKSDWDVICRLISLLMRYGIPLEEVLKQLYKTRYTMFTLSAILHRVLSKYLPEVELSEEDINYMLHQDAGEKCPVCGKNSFIIQGGCPTCINPECGYTKCG